MNGTITGSPFNGLLIKALKESAKRIYMSLIRPWRGIERMAIQELEASFYIKDYEQLHYLRHSIKNEEANESAFIGQILSVLKRDDVAFDVGANVGIHTVFMAKKVGGSGRVYAFEPEQYVAKMLGENLKLNGLDNVVLFQVALGAQKKEGELYLDPKIGKGSLSLIKTAKNTASQHVSIIPGDDLAQEEGLPIPNLIKIDVEGYEMSVLKGLKKTLAHKDCSCLCCEIHPFLLPAGFRQEDIMDYAGHFGFVPISIYPRGLETHVVFKKYSG